MKKISARSKARDVIAAIGIFDGVHRGHQKILSMVVAEARKKKAKSLVMTFNPHPRTVLKPDSKVPLLISPKHRSGLIRKTGVDSVKTIRFTKRFSRISPKSFIKNTLVKKFRVGTFIVGENFLFGRGHSGNFSFLKKLGRKLGFKLIAVRPFMFRGENISSTRIRRAIEKCDLKNSSIMLGRPVTVLGTVVRGRRVGRRLGFPTANINPHHEAIPPGGVYAVDVVLGEKKHKAILNIGNRPTFGPGREPTIELHIFNFNRYIYGVDVEIIFKKKIRDERKFDSAEDLRKQIQKDIRKAQ